MANSTSAKPTLQLHFDKTKRMDARCVFSRNSVGTYVNAKGVVSTALANQARFDHDPLTGECFGLLIEETRTNIINQSANFTVYQLGALLAFGSGSVANSTGTLAPDGSTNSDLCIPDTVAGYHYVDYDDTGVTTYTAGGYYTSSVWVKASGYTYFGMKQFYAVNGLTGFGAEFDLVAKTVAFSNSYDAKIVEYPNGWFRCSVTNIANSTATYPTRLKISHQIGNASNQLSYPGNGTSGVYMWGAQLEEDLVPTSYIPTSGTVVTRNLDALTIPASNWYMPTKGTFIGEMRSLVPLNTRGSDAIFVRVGDYTGKVLYRLDGFETYYASTGILVESSYANPSSVNAPFKWGFMYSASTASLAIDGTPSFDGMSVVGNFGNPGLGLIIGRPEGGRQAHHLKSLSYAPENATARQMSRLTNKIATRINHTLNLDFAGTGKMHSMIDTYSRASVGTAYNRLGYVKVFPSGSPRFGYNPITKESLGVLIEQSATNYLTYSEKLSGPNVNDGTVVGDWTWKAGLSTTVRAAPNASRSPDGMINSCKLISGTENTIHTWGQTTTVPNRLAAHSFSIYAKAGEYSQIKLQLIDGTMVVAGGAENASATFDLSTGLVVATSGSALNYYGMFPVGDGWYRCWVSAYQLNATAGAGTTQASVSLLSGGTTSFQGDGKSGLYVWGAQLEQSDFATSYIPSTDTFVSRASSASYYDATGTLITASTNLPRMSYDPRMPELGTKLLLENAATNTILDSQAYGSANWTLNGAPTVTLNYANSPAPDGTTSASRLQCTASSTGYFSLTTTVTAGIHYTYSVYLKNNDTRETVVILGVGGPAFGGGGDRNVTLNLKTGSVVIADPLIYNVNVIDVGNGWWRASLSFTPTTNGVPGLIVYGLWASSTGVDDFLVWGAQLEAGQSATSYIATTSAAVTRSADVSTSAQTFRDADLMAITGTNFSNFFNPLGGTFEVKFSLEKPVINTYSPKLFNVYNGVSSGVDNMMLFANSLTSLSAKDQNCVFRVRSGSVDSTVIDTDEKVVPWAINNVAASYATNNFAMAHNGTLGPVDTIGNVPTTFAALKIGGADGATSYINGYITQLTYTPKVVSTTLLKTMSK